MRRHRPWVCLLLVPALLASGCSAARHVDPSAPPHRELKPADDRGTELRSQLARAETRLRQLEALLQSSQRQAAAAEREVVHLRGRKQPTRAQVEQPARAGEPAGAAALAPGTAALPSPALTSGNPDPPGNAGRQDLAGLRAQVTAEAERSHSLEAQLASLRREISAGPFESSAKAHLREARRDIDRLEAALAAERGARENLERRYAELEEQARTASAVRGNSPGQADMIAALEKRQRRVLAAVQQDLLASRRRERQMRENIATTQGEGALSLADAVTNLRTESAALQSRLEEEHRRNGDLSAKLEVATRVVDLIFKMGAPQPASSGGASRPGAVESTYVDMPLSDNSDFSRPLQSEARAAFQPAATQ